MNIEDNFHDFSFSYLKSFLKKNKSFLKERLNSWFENKWRIYLDIKKNPNLKIVISRHPYDVIQFFKFFSNSFEKTSNLDFKSLIFSSFFKEGILHLLVAFLILKDDLKIKIPIEGLILVPYLNNRLEVYYFIIRNKKNKNFLFLNEVKKWLKSKQGIPSNETGNEYFLSPFLKKGFSKNFFPFNINLNNPKFLGLPSWIFQNNSPRPKKYKYSSDGKFIWLEGDFIESVWEDGIWEANSKFLASIWRDGVFNAKNGIFLKSIWENGYFKNGIFKESEWYKGFFLNGQFLKSEFKRGTFENGFFKESDFENGYFKNGIFKESYFFGGEWLDGFWVSGEFSNSAKWKIGWIFDPKREGNFEKNWIWKGDYVRSPINPNQYFE